MRHDTPGQQHVRQKRAATSAAIYAVFVVKARQIFGMLKLVCFPILVDPNMLFSKEYVGYLAKRLTKKLNEGEFIEAAEIGPVTERVHAALLDELTLEDRINDEVRAILEAYSDEMRKSGANYQEMFKKVKNELVRKYKAVL
jgi:Protein of unknown function (DUF507)